MKASRLHSRGSTQFLDVEVVAHLVLILIFYTQVKNLLIELLLHGHKNKLKHRKTINLLHFIANTQQ